MDDERMAMMEELFMAVRSALNSSIAIEYDQSEEINFGRMPDYLVDGARFKALEAAWQNYRSKFCPSL